MTHTIHELSHLYCPARTRCPDSGSAAYEAVQYCESGTSADCDIYAQGRRIVWPHEFPWPLLPETEREYRKSIGQGTTPSPAAKTREDAPVAAKPEPRRTSAKQRTFTLTWEGSADVFKGTMEIAQGKRSGRISSVMLGRDCEGQFWFTSGRRGQWEIDCGDGWASASGDFTANSGPKGGGRGTGTDNHGWKVVFVVDPRS